MTVERDIAGVAFPFAAGVTAAVLFIGPFTSHHAACPLLALWLTILCTAGLILSIKLRWNSSIQWGLICLCMLTCGAFVGLNAHELNISELSAPGPLSKAAHKWGMELGRMIENIPFTKESTGSIITALLTGNRENIPPETTQAFRDSGASHILALSGLHLGVIYIMIAKALSIMGNSRKIRILRSCLTIFICGFYTLATGAGASITRAFIFIALKEIASMTGRHSSLEHILAASLMLHLAFAPMSVMEIGFQLSYAAMFGIVYIYPRLKGIWKNNWIGIRHIWNSAALSISCQLTTGPLAYHYFGTFPQHFLLTNLLAMPLAGLIIPVALLTVSLTALGGCPSILIHATEGLVTAMTETLKIIASM